MFHVDLVVSVRLKYIDICSLQKLSHQNKQNINGGEKYFIFLAFKNKCINLRLVISKCGSKIL